MFCSLFTQSIYYVRLPQPVGKDKNTIVHLLKESAYPLLNAFPINPFHYSNHICFVLYIFNGGFQIRRKKSLTLSVELK